MEYIIIEMIKIIKESDPAIVRETKLLYLFIRLFTEALGCALETINANTREFPDEQKPPFSRSHNHVLVTGGIL